MVKEADRSRHIKSSKKPGYSMCGVHVGFRVWLTYSPSKKDSFEDLEKKRVCLKCVNYFLAERNK